MTKLALAFGDVAVGWAWIGALTPVSTPRGPVEARHLRPGNLVSTRDGQTRVQSVARAEVPLCDGAAPVLLRAPYFAARYDLLVSSEQPVILQGAAVEYLFGEEAVQADARLLVDGRTALSVADHAMADAVALVLDRVGSVVADGCALGVPGRDGAALRALCAYEVAAFRSHRWEGSLGCVA